jgi:hypothetical protein
MTEIPRKERFESLQLAFAMIIDVWSLAHIFWGAACATTVWLLDPLWSFIITVSIALLNELFECTSCGIKFCGLFAHGYTGDVLLNSAADVNFNMLGWNIVLCIYNTSFLIFLPIWVVVLAMLFGLAYKYPSV